MSASPPLPDPTPQLAAVQARLRPYAVWRAEGSETPELGEWRFERFLAVVEDERRFTRWQQQVQEIEQTYRDAGLLRAPERRMPSFFDEVWDHCALHVKLARTLEEVYGIQPSAPSHDEDDWEEGRVVH